MEHWCRACIRTSHGWCGLLLKNSDLPLLMHFLFFVIGRCKHFQDFTSIRQPRLWSRRRWSNTRSLLASSTGECQTLFNSTQLAPGNSRVLNNFPVGGHWPSQTLARPKKELPSRPGQVDLPSEQVAFCSHLPNRQRIRHFIYHQSIKRANKDLPGQAEIQFVSEPCTWLSVCLQFWSRLLCCIVRLLLHYWA